MLDSSMRKLWLVLMAVVMLGQWSYAAAGTYCSHEGERSLAVAHWGHHFHSHASQEQGKDSPDSKAGFHGDCAFCHATGAFGPASFAAVDLGTHAVPLNPAVPWRPTGLSADTPERPQWRVPALA